jgi:hypothetical protein
VYFLEISDEEFNFFKMFEQIKIAYDINIENKGEIEALVNQYYNVIQLYIIVYKNEVL